jgi:hypothetical protein
MKTAVEFLEEIIQEQRENGDTDLRTILYYCREAKEMEKQQLHNIRQMLIEGALTNMSCSSAIIEFDKLTFKSE